VQGGTSVLILAAQGADQQQRGVGFEAQQKVKPLQRVTVTPLDVVE